MMAEKEDRRIRQGDYERYYNRIRAANTPGEEFDELEYLKEQYVDGQLTEAEFERRLEELDSLEESDTRESAAPFTYYLMGAVVGGGVAVTFGVAAYMYALLGLVAAMLTGLATAAIFVYIAWGGIR